MKSLVFIFRDFAENEYILKELWAKRRGSNNKLSIYDQGEVERAEFIYNPKNLYVYKSRLCDTGYFTKKGLILALDRFGITDSTLVETNGLGSDTISPDHYNSGEIQDIDYIEEKGFGRGFNAGSVIKHVSQYRKTNGVEDLNKALCHLKRLIDLEEQGEEDEDTPPSSKPYKSFVFSLTRETSRRRLDCNSLQVLAYSELEARRHLCQNFDLFENELKLKNREGS